MQTELKKAILSAVKKETENEKEVALFFSGGIDSALIGKILSDSNVNVVPITVGTEKSRDMLAAKKYAQSLFKKHVAVYINKKTIKRIIPDVMNITGKSDAVTISVGCVVYMAAKYASMLGLKTVFTGAGSDEIFAGYSSHEKAMQKGWDEVQNECKRRLEGITKDTERDAKICESFGLKVRTPFLSEKVIKIALSIPPKEKISEDAKKIIIRKISKELGLPDGIVNRKKKAAQYGSGVQKILKKLSNDGGFGSISDYLKDYNTSLKQSL